MCYQNIYDNRGAVECVATLASGKNGDRNHERRWDENKLSTHQRPLTFRAVCVCVPVWRIYICMYAAHARDLFNWVIISD